MVAYMFVLVGVVLQVLPALTVLRQFCKKVKAPQWRDMAKALVQTLQKQSEKVCVVFESTKHGSFVLRCASPDKHPVDTLML